MKSFLFVFLLPFFSGINSSIIDEEVLKEIDSAVKKIEVEKIQVKKQEHVCYDKQELGCFYTNGPLEHVGYLPMSPEEIDTKFYVYRRKVKKVSVVNYLSPKTFKNIPQNGSIAVLIHGFSNDGSEEELISLRNALLAKVPTVIFVDWHKGAKSPWYLSAATNTQLVGRQVAVLFDKLIKARKISRKKVHLLGFSLGAQVSGFAGKWSSRILGWKFGRISGLDAAAPVFEGHPGAYLTKDDADFVDGIHTSAGHNIIKGQVGFREPFGHVDFYPNGGDSQPHCSMLSLTCNHYAAVVYMDTSIRAESMCQFMAYKCTSWEDFINGKCTGQNRSQSKLGYGSGLLPGRGMFYLVTGEEYPYCKIVNNDGDLSEQITSVIDEVANIF